MLDAGKTEHVFIPGKNWRLSLAELVSFLDTRKTDFAVREFSREFFEVNIDAGDSHLSADDFGGIIKIGVVKGVFPTQLLKNFFIENDKISQGADQGKYCVQRFGCWNAWRRQRGSICLG